MTLDRDPDILTMTDAERISGYSRQLIRAAIERGDLLAIPPTKGLTRQYRISRRRLVEWATTPITKEVA